MPANYSGGVLTGYAPPTAPSGQLPWGGGGAAALQPGGYPAAYNSSLAQNQSNYNNILAGYQKTLQSQTTAQAAIQAGYSNLYNQVQEKIAGQGATRAADIRADAAQKLGSGTQGLINRGLGNTTVLDSVGRGIGFDEQRNLTANSESVAALQAQSMSQLGLAGLNYQDYANRQNTGLVQDQLGWMNSVNAPYPNAGLYAQLAQQRGMVDEGNRGQGSFGGGSFAGGRGSSGQLGYVPSPTPSFGGGVYSPAQSTGGGGSWMAAQNALGLSGGGYNYGGASGQALDYGGGGDWGATGGGFDYAGAGGAIAGGAGQPADFGEYWDDYQ